MTYHIYRELNPKGRRPGHPKVLNESMYCDSCWNREFFKVYSEDKNPKEHRAILGEDHDRCDSCRPLDI